MTLHVIKGKNSYCGPGAISALTGKTTDQVADVIKKAYNKPYVKRTTWSHLKTALQAFGYIRRWPQRPEMVAVHSHAAGTQYRKPTLNNWSKIMPQGEYIVNVPGHWVVIRKVGNRVTVVDNHSKIPSTMKGFKGKGAHVLSYAKIEKKEV